MGGGGPPYQRPNVVETKYIVKKNGPMGTSNQANAAASFFAKAHQKLQLNNNGLHDLSLRNNGGQGCSPASSRRFQVGSVVKLLSTIVKSTVFQREVLEFAPLIGRQYATAKSVHA